MMQAAILLLVAAHLTVHCAAAAAVHDNSNNNSNKEAPPLQTYFLDVRSPIVTLSPEEPREGVSRLTVQLLEGSVNSHMPVITASVDPGVMHDVVHTWTWLQRYAEAHVKAKRVKTIWNKPRYPLPGVVFKAASALRAPQDVPGMAEAIAEEQAQSFGWTHCAAPSALLMLPGQAVAAVADVLSVTADGQDGGISVTLDVVHSPHTFSEFKPHGLQRHDHRAHYHFLVPDGVALDAAAFLQKLQQAAHQPQGLHVFMKGLPDYSWHWHLETVADE